MRVLLTARCLLVLIATSYFLSSPVDAFGATDTTEVYQYRSSPKGTDRPRSKESVQMTFRTTNEHMECSSQTIHDKFIEDVNVTTDLKGQLIFATRTTKKKVNKKVTDQCTIWLKDDKVHIKTSQKKTEVRRIEHDQKSAVDLSLLYLMRSFPFETDEEWQVLMADFSGRFITVAIRNRGKERLTVPAGHFQCYRMEVTISVLMLKARINYWLTTTEPHFLVKHEGKKGPFTRKYTTVLVTSPRGTTDGGAEQGTEGDGSQTRRP